MQAQLSSAPNNPRKFAAAFAVAVAAVGVGALAFIQRSAVNTFDPSTIDICSQNTLCDNAQIKISMYDANGHVSIASPIGKSLRDISEKHAPGKISDAAVVDLMSRLDGTLTHAMPTTTAVGINGMMLMKGPQDAGKKAQYGLYAFVQDGDHGCGVYEIKMDGSTVASAVPMNVRSHSSPVPGCVQEVTALSKTMMKKFSI